MPLASAANATCAPLCWIEKDEYATITYRLIGCYGLNISVEFKLTPAYNGNSVQRIEARLPGYSYRNSWSDFSLGDGIFAYQSWRNRWTWNLDLSEIVNTEISQSDAKDNQNRQAFDTLRFSSTIYKIHNATAIARVDAQLLQEINFSGPVAQSVTQTTKYFPRVTDGCNNKA